MRIRIVSYNIHKCIGGIDRRYDPERICNVISHYQPDVVLLQEVDRDVKRSNFDAQSELLGNKLAMPYRSYFPNVSVYGGGEYGNAILSRFPIEYTQNLDLTVGIKKRRSALHASCSVAPALNSNIPKSLHIFNVHLGLANFERKIQLQKFLQSDLLQSIEETSPILIAGDFNDVWGNLRPILENSGFRGTNNTIRTFPAFAPLRALDRIYVRGDVQMRRPRASSAPDIKTASDHLPIVADITIAA